MWPSHFFALCVHRQGFCVHLIPVLNLVHSSHNCGAAHGSSSADVLIMVLLSHSIPFVSDGNCFIDTRIVLIFVSVRWSSPGPRGNCSAPIGTLNPGDAVVPGRSCKATPSLMKVRGRIWWIALDAEAVAAPSAPADWTTSLSLLCSG